VPSIIYYDKKGCVKAIGAEAIKDGIHEAAIEGNWYKAEWSVIFCQVHYSRLMVLYQVQTSFEIQIHK
jgi:hypothetical protein